VVKESRLLTAQTEVHEAMRQFPLHGMLELLPNSQLFPRLVYSIVTGYFVSL
jgi:hypothetical protein